MYIHFYPVCFEEDEQLWSLLFLSCKYFNVAYYSKSIISINTKLAYHDKAQLHDKGHNSDSHISAILSSAILTKYLVRMVVLDIGTACGALVLSFLEVIFKRDDFIHYFYHYWNYFQGR